MIVMVVDRFIKRRNIMRVMQTMVSIYKSWRLRLECSSWRRVKCLVIRRKGCTW